MTIAENLLAKFHQIIQNQKLSHIYLIEGGNDVEQKKFLYDLAELFLKITSISSCLKQMIQVNHYPNFYYLSSYNNLITKEQILAMQQHFHHTSLINSKKMYVLYKAEHISEKAAHSLLHFLENPVNNQILGILFTNNHHLLLSTILSRVQIFHLTSSSSIFPQNSQKILNPLDQVFFNLLKKKHNNISSDFLLTSYYLNLKKFFFSFCQWKHISFDVLMEFWFEHKDLLTQKVFIEDFLILLLVFCLDLYKYRSQSLGFVFPVELFSQTWLVKLSEQHFQSLLNLLNKIEKQKTVIEYPFCFMGFLIEIMQMFNG
ncbi:hypothetical protein [Candidatus Phytoplasma phoenicium]|uniref:DNA polymerase III delta prime subunit n=1 Tax=Candidatus Phytoplasma phoenicium TaxID=198422 RepID=A0A0L0ML74_9MOLU|nr:hypothetical protein [Candidatus Phytoplasma phoenicium]KND62759.1 DNA polymerase III delta prime subunit [Candidatus Phytoplasma phoenicium]